MRIVISILGKDWLDYYTRILIVNPPPFSDWGFDYVGGRSACAQLARLLGCLACRGGNGNNSSQAVPISMSMPCDPSTIRQTNPALLIQADYKNACSECMPVIPILILI